MSATEDIFKAITKQNINKRTAVKQLMDSTREAALLLVMEASA